MRFKQWVRDHNKVIKGLTEDPLINLMISMFSDLGIKARGFDVEDLLKTNSGSLVQYRPQIHLNGGNLVINTTVGKIEKPLDVNIHFKED